MESTPYTIESGYLWGCMMLKKAYWDFRMLRMLCLRVIFLIIMRYFKELSLESVYVRACNNDNDAKWNTHKHPTPRERDVKWCWNKPQPFAIIMALYLYLRMVFWYRFKEAMQTYLYKYSYICIAFIKMSHVHLLSYSIETTFPIYNFSALFLVFYCSLHSTHR